MPNKTVSTEKAKEFADSLGMLHIEVSAKESTNVEGAFSLLARRLIEARAERLMKKNGSQKGESVTISSQSSSGSSSACCS
jgi:Ras-related protein Rab-1A